MMKKLFMLFAASCAASAFAAVVDVDVSGKSKIGVSISVANRAYVQSLKRNLELSGLFEVRGDGKVAVAGTAGGAVTVTGRGKQISASDPVTDDASARMAARRLSDAMCEAFGDQKGFACDRIAFVNRHGANNADLCMCYPDGFDVRQLTKDGAGVVGPRWKDANTLFYTFLKSGPQVYEYDIATCHRKMRWQLKGMNAGAAVSPDGRRVAVIMSFEGNPELYVIDGNRYVRLTKTLTASEGQPCWSPDGRQIVYVSNETRHPQLYVIDVATKAKRRLTSRGIQNVDPDWGPDGRIAYISGSQIAVIDPAAGESSAKVLECAGKWEHPSWARDGRHVVAGSGNKLFVVDTKDAKDGGDSPKQLFSANGTWITPSWSRVK